MKKKKISNNSIIIFIALLVILAVFLIIVLSSKEKPIEEDINEHGCLGSAGYIWNESDQMCVREREKKSCSPESKTVEVCIEIYQPVCGLPIKKTYSNFCFACMEKDVKYYIPGECLG